VVIVTGLGVASAEWAESLGARAVLKKPFDSPDLLREVARCFADRLGKDYLTNRKAG
jgi:hypothetical protein